MEVNIDSPHQASSDGSPWVGGTGLGNLGLGKSGRVIERLMAENDKLRREMKAEIAKREELQRALQTSKPKLEGLMAENSRLTNIKTMDDNIILRRDRKIAELKAEVELERQKREAAERRANEADRQREDERDESRKVLQAEKEMARHATAHAEILQTSHQQLAREYRQRIAGVHKSLRDLQTEREEDRKRMARLDVVLGQMRQETERMRKLYGEFTTLFDKYAEQKDKEFEGLTSKPRELSVSLDEREAQNIKLAEAMTEVLNKMKWVLRMDSLSRGTDSPPPSPGEGVDVEGSG